MRVLAFYANFNKTEILNTLQLSGVVSRENCDQKRRKLTRLEQQTKEKQTTTRTHYMVYDIQGDSYFVNSIVLAILSTPVSDYTELKLYKL